MKENKKCRATSKVIFPTRIDAKAAIWSLKIFARKKNPQTGKRIKHRKGKVAQRRAYHCKYCNGYHLTSWKESSYIRRFLVKKREPV